MDNGADTVNRRFTCDFVIPKRNLWVEVCGRDMLRMKNILKQYLPNKNYVAP
jgi:hypothetical protein